MNCHPICSFYQRKTENTQQHNNKKKSEVSFSSLRSAFYVQKDLSANFLLKVFHFPFNESSFSNNGNLPLSGLEQLHAVKLKTKIKTEQYSQTKQNMHK